MIAGLLASPLRALIGAALVFAAGFAAAEAYERRAPWGLAAQRAAMEKDRDDWRAASTAWQVSAAQWEAAQKRCAYSRNMERRAAAERVETASDTEAAARGAGFDQGFFAGNQAGARKCGAADAKVANPGGPRPSPVAGGVRDDWPGAYQPAP